MPTMPNVVGQELYTAQASLQTAGVLVPTSIGYFGTWPITALWQLSTQPIFTVLTQSVAQGATILANAPVSLGVAQPKIAVAFP